MKIKTYVVFLLSAMLALAPALAGVVYEIEVTDHEQSPPKTESIEAAVEGRNLKMGIAAGSTSGRGEMIFRGDRREMVVVDHEDKSYIVMDTEAVAAIAGQVSGAMSQMEEAMKTWEKPTMDRKTMIQTLKLRVFDHYSPAQTEFRFNPSKNYRSSETLNYARFYYYKTVINSSFAPCTLL